MNKVLKKICEIFGYKLLPKNYIKNNRRDGRVVEGARLESVYTVKGIKGSNPFLSAK